MINYGTLVLNIFIIHVWKDGKRIINKAVSLILAFENLKVSLIEA